jgi:hypothetical protein
VFTPDDRAHSEQQAFAGFGPVGGRRFWSGDFQFAMTYHAYDVWSDFATVRGAAEQTWAAREVTGALPSSLAKLRTSLFGAARYMRMTDFDEVIAGIPGSEAAWIELMREHVAAIERAVRRGPKQHLHLAPRDRQSCDTDF